MSRKTKVDWYSQDVIFAVDTATDEILTELAFQGEGIAKTGAPVDTGFMRNAIYAVAPQGNHRSQAEADARAAADRPLAGTAEVGQHEAAIHGAAEYTAFQEMRVGFLYAALQQLQAIAPGVIRAVGRETIGD